MKSKYALPIGILTAHFIVCTAISIWGSDGFRHGLFRDGTFLFYFAFLNLAFLPLSIGIAAIADMLRVLLTGANRHRIPTVICGMLGILLTVCNSGVS